MEGKVKKAFPGGNTSQGSYSFFDYIIPENVKRVFCLKGGPGVGKSSLMKKIYKEFLHRGYDIDLYHCPSDPSSLDGLVIKKLGVVLMDATAPHTMDPKLPGALDEIINLGDYWNTEELEKNKQEISVYDKDISNSFKRAFKFLKSAEPIFRDIEEKYSDCMDYGKVNLVTEEFIKRLFDGVKSTGNLKREKHLFGSAITPVGCLDYTENILKDVNKVYYLAGEIGTGKTTLLNKVYKKAIEKGLNVEVYHYPLIPEKIETVLLTDLDIGITISTTFKEEETIDLNQFLNREKLLKYEEDIKFDEKVLDDLICWAVLNLKRAKSKHDIIESYYSPNMRFDEVGKLRDKLIKRILKYEENL
ncbi:TPA: ATP-binding protein [Clostridioides difficile]|uniref:ATP-binding protein n=1 Tax=Clostridioides difficile TaxID=1496 RepID=UPI000D1E28C5|nr:ATP-binding protein [Clostridioides difficile]EKS6786330.1 ATP-binding protein [Clostridioides difficile]MBY2549877.1 ATP-binding protein [Clostridioides difficile]MCR1465051.1 ATP-binding protein [Clostridioides difficile]MDV9722039.1 ATP-binding protein [Clostridioides difficile]PTL49195.1 ATP-binding protein [Clostridioides difficile]